MEVKSLLEKERGPSLAESITTLRLEHENQLQKLFLILKERDQVKNQLLYKEKENELSCFSETKL